MLHAFAKGFWQSASCNRKVVSYMEFTETNLRGAFVLQIKKIEDERGYFGRAWCQEEFLRHAHEAF